MNNNLVVCKKKRVYFNRKVARKKARRARLLTGNRLIRAYRCDICGNFHIGHCYERIESDE